jgi:hypothetical protein
MREIRSRSSVAVLGRFYRELLYARITYESGDLVALRAKGIVTTAERTEDHQAPDLPDGKVPKRLNIDFLVDDPDSGKRAALAIGARKAAVQPSPGR